MKMFFRYTRHFLYRAAVALCVALVAVLVMIVTGYTRQAWVIVYAYTTIFLLGMATNALHYYRYRNHRKRVW